MVSSRHRNVATRFVVNLKGAPDTPSLGAAASAMWSLTGTMGFGPPSWSVGGGSSSENVGPEDLEPGSVRRGWQHEAASRVDRHFREHVSFDRLPPRDRAQVRSQRWFGVNCSLHVVSHEDSRSPLSRDSVATSPSPSSSHLAHVPVWPSNRLVGLGFWDGGDMRWRVRQHACAAKLVDVWQQMCSFGTWTWLRLT